MIKKILLILLTLLSLAALAQAEVTLSCTPTSPALGEVVDVKVEAGTGAVSVRYELSVPGKTVFKGEEDTHFTAAFRPRTQNTYTLKVTVSFEDGSSEEASAEIAVSGEAAETEAGADVVYSQKDGSWKDKSYSSKSNLEKSGCAIFALSHALQRMGFEGEDVQPEKLGKTFANCLTEGGTANARLISTAAEIWGFTTEDELYESEKSIAAMLQNGDLFSFAVVIGHIAMVSGISEDGKKVQIVDSAPLATFERIKKGNIYIQLEDGSFQQVSSAEEIPGARWYFETSQVGGLEYWMDLSYVARRGVRLIRPPWCFYEQNGESTAVQPQSYGTAYWTVTLAGEEMLVSTFDLDWNDVEDEEKQFAIVQKKAGTKLKDSDGKNLKSLSACTILPVLQLQQKQALVIYKGQRGYVSLSDVQLVGKSTGVNGVISLKGNTSGRASVKIRYAGSDKGKVLDEWKTGTEVIVLKKSGNFYQIEGKGIRAWIHQDYLTIAEADLAIIPTE